MANSDQFIVNGTEDFLEFARRSSGHNGSIMTFKATHPKWSFARLDEDGFVEEVAEKKPISDNATVGLYYFKKGRDFVAGAEQMIRKNITVNNEFYVCPVYNELILAEKKISIFDIGDRMHGI